MNTLQPSTCITSWNGQSDTNTKKETPNGKPTHQFYIRVEIMLVTSLSSWNNVWKDYRVLSIVRITCEMAIWLWIIHWKRYKCGFLVYVFIQIQSMLVHPAQGDLENFNNRKFYGHSTGSTRHRFRYFITGPSDRIHKVKWRKRTDIVTAKCVSCSLVRFLAYMHSMLCKWS